MGEKDMAPSGDWNPFKDVRRLMESMDKGADSPRVRVVGPEVKLRETPKEVIVSALVPGFDRDDIQVDISEEMITIRGELGTEQGERGKIRSAGFQSFIKTLRLPSPVKADQAKAGFKDGVLIVHLAKLRRSKARKTDAGQ